MKKEFFPYPKEIIKHFKHPKGLGRLKDADAIGEAGNLLCGDIMRIYIKVKKSKRGYVISDIKGEVFGCLPEDQEVVKANGSWVPISSIHIGSTVLNANGKKSLVSRITIREYSGPILKIVPFVSPFNSFLVTPDHLILCIKRKWLKSAQKSSPKCKWLRVNNDELLSAKPVYIPASEIEPGDYLVFVVNKEVNDNPQFTPEVMRLMGFYLAEGYLASKGYVVAFSFNKKEKEAIEEVKALVKKILGKEPRERIRKNVKEVYVCSKRLADFLNSVCGKLARHKKLSDEVMLLPFKKQWEMLKTYLIGDGSTRKRWPNESPTYTAATTSKSLAIQIQQILARGGIFASVKKYRVRESKIEGRKIKSSIIYEISFKLRRKHKFIHTNGKYFLVPVKKIEKESYEGCVRDLELVGNPHSYLVRGFCVHNCIVAIANTSLLTTLVKGKPLEDVLKLSKEELIRRLGGREKIPPFKIHCSVLALDALHEAIYNFYKKKKMPIPPELKKRHEAIQKTLRIIEERHKEFVEMERKILSDN